MMKLVVIAALISIAVTALLTWVLWRLNGPRAAHQDRGDDGGGGGVYAPVSDTHHRHHNHDSDAGDGGGGDGGGD